METLPVYIGTYTRHGKSQGIYRCRFDPDAGSLTVVDVYTGIVDPTYLIFSRDRRTLYAAAESPEAGEVCALRVQADGSLSMLTRTPLPVRSLCQLTCRTAGDALVGAGYRSGSLVSVRLLPDGATDELISDIRHSGHGVHPVRQTQPHVHSAFPTPDGRFVLVCDLGLDSITTYAVAPDSGVLTAVASLTVTAGDGPRHTAVSADGKRAYVVTELSNRVLTCAIDAQSGGLTLLHTTDTLPLDFSGESTAADIHLSPDERFLYVSNRGADDIACLKLNAERLPVYSAAFSTHGKTPRHFALTDDGRYLLAANQDSDTVAVFARDDTTGALALRSLTPLPSPACVLL